MTRIPCQDAHAVRVLSDSTLALAVADGAGSARRAAEGASAAAEAAAAFLGSSLTNGTRCDPAACRELLEKCVLHSRSRLETIANAVSAERGGGREPQPVLPEFATTLLVCFLDSHWFASAQLGDGAIVLRTGDTLELIQPERRSEYLNETDFLTSDSAVQRLSITVRPVMPIDAVALFTDGVEWAAVRYRERAPHEAFFSPLFAYAARMDASTCDLEEFLSSERFCEQTDDDKTLVLAVRK